MSDKASAYAALGLEPGADRAAVEQAYRDLIKRYHPDRSGGDAARASEINRAYFELRQAPPAEAGPAARPRRRPHRRTSRRRRRSSLWPVLFIAAGILLIVERERFAAQVPRWLASLEKFQAAPLAGGRAGAVGIHSDAFDGPLDEKAIARSLEQAVRLAGRGDEAGAAATSRDCHRRMRQDPALAQLDRCAAFDNAVAALADGDPMTAAGPFSASAITARQMNAGSLLSSDYLAIERRLDRIRTLVQLTLRPAPPPVEKIIAQPEPEVPEAEAEPDADAPAG